MVGSKLHKIGHARRNMDASRRKRAASLLVAGFSAIGILLLSLAQGATYSSGHEAEDGQVNRQANVAPGEGDSGQGAVRFTPQASGGRQVTVTTAAQLASALSAVRAGDTITMADGTYNGNFNSTASGTASQPIILTGSRNAIIKGTAVSSGYTLSLGRPNSISQVAYWHVQGITIANGKKGIVFDRVQNSVIDGVLVRDIGEEGIHLRDFSSDNIVKNSTVTRTGLQTQGFGEGLYVGSAISNWPNSSQGNPDNSNNNQLLDNDISQTGAENIDIKEASHGGIIRGNRLDGSDMCPISSDSCNSADSLIDLKGDGWQVTGNSGGNVRVVWSDSKPENDGFQVHVVSGAEPEHSGSNNVFRQNRLNNLGGYGFNVSDKSSGNVIDCNNQVSDAGKGLANVACR